MDTIVKRLHVKILGYAQWSMCIIISQLKEHSISVDQGRYATYVVVNFLDNVTIKEILKIHKTTLPHYKI